MDEITTEQACKLLSCGPNGLTEVEALTLIGKIICSINSSISGSIGEEGEVNVNVINDSLNVNTTGEVIDLENLPSNATGSDSKFYFHPNGGLITWPRAMSARPDTSGVFDSIKSMPIQYSGSPNNFTIGTTSSTVFTLAEGERGFIQNLSTTPLAIKSGSGASTTSFNFILKGGIANDDGTGGYIKFTDALGSISVAPMSGSARYIAWKHSV